MSEGLSVLFFTKWCRNVNVNPEKTVVNYTIISWDTEFFLFKWKFASLRGCVRKYNIDCPTICSQKNTIILLENNIFSKNHPFLRFKIRFPPPILIEIRECIIYLACYHYTHEPCVTAHACRLKKNASLLKRCGQYIEKMS